MQSLVDNLLARLSDAKKNGNGWSARCPAHDDQRASLSVSLGDNGGIVLHCHAGCETAAVVQAVGMTMGELMPAAEPKNRTRRIVAKYDYCDESGKLLFQAVRYEPKDFRQRKPKSSGGWEWSVRGVRIVPYRLPELLADMSRPVYVVEGEKDCDNLAGIGVIATCNAGGAGKWTAKHAEFLRGRDVIVLPDNDNAGRKHARHVVETLQGKAASVRTVTLPNLQPKGDVSDWFDARDAAEPDTIRAELEALATQANDIDSGESTAAAASGPIITCLADIEPREIAWLWPGRIPLGRITLLVGRPGEGKSFLTSDMAARITTGTPWPDGGPCPRGSVILIAAEDDPADTIRPRLDAHNADVRKVHLLSAVRRVDETGQYDRLVSLADLDAIEETLKRLPDCRLIVVDPIGSFLGGSTDSHRDNEVRAVLAPVARLAEQFGPAVLVVAHRRKSAGSFADDLALGSRAFTGIARAVWHLSRDTENKSRRLLLPGKCNLAAEGSGLAFSIDGTPARITWERDPVEMSADDALAVENGGIAKPGPEAVTRSGAADWLRELLAAGPMEASKIKDEATAAGYAWRTVHRAKDALSVQSSRRGFGGGSLWALPVDTCHVPQGSDNLASWHNSENPDENAPLQPGAVGTCQDRTTWHDCPGGETGHYSTSA